MRYQVIIPKSVQKKLDGFPSSVTDRILEQMAELEIKPRSPVPLLRSGESTRAIVPAPPLQNQPGIPVPDRGCVRRHQPQQPRNV